MKSTNRPTLPTVTIATSAYNEEANIGRLLSSLLVQKETGFRIIEIIVISDGSFDKTVEIVKSFKIPKIRLYVGHSRKGQQARQNQIINYFKGDILVLVEADTLPANEYCISEVVKPFQRNSRENIGMVVGGSWPVAPTIFFEKIIYQNTRLQRKILEKYSDGNNLYLCAGHSLRAFKRSIATKLKWPLDAPEDAYAYLRLKESGLKILRRKKAINYMRNVTHFKDRTRQSTKFLSGKKALMKYFNQHVVEEAYQIPKIAIISQLLIELGKSPFWTILLILEFIFNRIYPRKISKFNPIYDVYYSTKNFNLVKN